MNLYFPRELLISHAVGLLAEGLIQLLQYLVVHDRLHNDAREGRSVVFVLLLEELVEELHRFIHEHPDIKLVDLHRSIAELLKIELTELIRLVSWFLSAQPTQNTLVIVPVLLALATDQL